MSGAEQIGIDAAINVDGPDRSSAHDERGTDDRANAIGHDAFLLFHLDLRIVGQHGLFGAHDALYGAAAEIEGARVDGAFLLIARDGKGQFFCIGINQHEEAAFSVNHTNHLVHDLAQYLVEDEGRVERAGNLVEGLKLVALQIVDAGVKGFTWALNTTGSRGPYNHRWEL